jgi:hypothetical protein
VFQCGWVGGRGGSEESSKRKRPPLSLSLSPSLFLGPVCVCASCASPTSRLNQPPTIPTQTNKQTTTNNRSSATRWWRRPTWTTPRTSSRSASATTGRTARVSARPAFLLAVPSRKEREGRMSIIHYVCRSWACARRRGFRAPFEQPPPPPKSTNQPTDRSPNQAKPQQNKPHNTTTHNTHRGARAGGPGAGGVQGPRELRDAALLPPPQGG